MKVTMSFSLGILTEPIKEVVDNTNERMLASIELLNQRLKEIDLK